MKRFLGVIVLASVLGFVISCDITGPQIVRITPDKSQLKPAESTVLHSEIDNPEELELEYAWEADAGTIEPLGDSARWTAPDFLWMDSTVTITLTIEDTQGNIDDENVTLQVQVTSQELQAADDTYTLSADPDNNFASADNFFVGYDADWPGFYHAFLQFSTPTIPAGEALQGVRLRLRREYGEGEDCWIDFYIIRQHWQGSNVTWNDEPVTDQIAYLSINDDSQEKGWFYVPLGTSVIDDWIGNPESNHGFMVALSDEGDMTHRFRNYISIEGPSDEHPVLEVVSW